MNDHCIDFNAPYMDKIPMHYTDVDIVRDLISWCDELKADRYSRKLGGLEQMEYFRLMKTLAAANNLLVKMKRDQDDGE